MPVTGSASKAVEQSARIAGAMTLWRNYRAPLCEVSVQDMSNAISLARFYLGEAMRLASAAQVSQDYAMGPLKPGVSCAEVTRKINDLFAECNLLHHRSFGYGHSFGVLKNGRKAGLELR